jgi:hypothetical protein
MSAEGGEPDAHTTIHVHSIPRDWFDQFMLGAWLGAGFTLGVSWFLLLSAALCWLWKSVA